jgi:hypothetical protein
VLSRRLTYVLMAAAILALDALTGPYIQPPVMLVIPVILAAWYCNGRFALGLVVVTALCRFLIAVYLEHSEPARDAVINALLRVGALGFIAYLGAQTRRNLELARKVKVLEGLLPTCANCKKIRNERNEWEQIELYIMKHSEASFTHGFCPECYQKLYGEVLPDAKAPAPAAKLPACNPPPAP